MARRATPEALDAMREYLGLKQPLYVQYGMFIKRAIQLDLGETIFTREKVSREIGQKFPATIELAVVAMLISCFLGIILGIISATKQYSWFDYTAMVTSLFGVSMPVFWLGPHAHAPFFVEPGLVSHVRPDRGGDRSADCDEFPCARCDPCP